MTDIELLKRYIAADGIPQKIEKNYLTEFYSGDKIYEWTNERLKEYYDKDATNKKVLAVTSSGDHILHAALGGAKEITGFDINRFCKYYSALKVAMIKAYNYDDFIDVSIRNLPDILCDVKVYLTEQEILFWETYVAFCDKGYTVLFDRCWNFNELFILNAYFEEKLYLQLKNNLNSCEIKYVDCGIDKLQKKVDEKYDIVYLSNILAWVEEKDYNLKIGLLNDLYSLLKNDGKILDYCFEFANWHPKEDVVQKNTKFYSASTTLENDDIVYTYSKKVNMGK